MSTKFNPQLVNWLKRTKASDTDSVAIYQFSHEDSLYRELILTCVASGLLEYQEHDTDVIYYTLTDAGKRALGTDTGGGGSGANNNRFYVVYVERKKDAVYMVWDSVLDNTFSAAYKTEEEAQAEADRLFAAHIATPQAASEATGYEIGLEAGQPILTHNGAPINEHGIVLHIADMAKVVRIMNEQTATLRSENARLQRELAETQRERDSKHEHLMEHGTGLRNAGMRIQELQAELEAAREQYRVETSKLWDGINRASQILNSIADDESARRTVDMAKEAMEVLRKLDSD